MNSYKLAPIKVSPTNICEKIDELLSNEFLSVPLYMNLLSLKNYISVDNSTQKDQLMEFFV